MVHKVEYPVYVLKGSGKPPFFIINDVPLESDTENWYEFCMKKFFSGVPQTWMLEVKK